VGWHYAILDQDKTRTSLEHAVPNDLVADAWKMAEAWGFVAVAAVPAGFASALVAWWFRRAILPRWKHHHTPWSGLDILLLFFLYMLLTPALSEGLRQAGFFHAVYGAQYPPIPEGLAESIHPHGAVAGAAAADAAVRRLADLHIAGLWGRIFAAPAIIAVAALILLLTERKVPRVDLSSWPSQVTLGILSWTLFTPIVFAVYFVVLLAMQGVDGEPDVHPLSRAGVGTAPFDQAIFAVSVCVFTPIAEEFIFRGLVVRWAAGAWYRPWGLMTGAAVLGVLPGGRFDPQPGPVVFLAVLGIGLYMAQRFSRRLWRKFPVRTASAVFASAALFAVVHAGVWPSPIALFVFGLALGYVAARSGGIVGCVVLHGLFNAVSFVYLLRGGAG
jgi:membrane protease YdiL (CAAX protease family)